MRVQARHRDARLRLAPMRRRPVRDADRLQHRVESHGVDGATQRQVDRHQHRAQLLVGQHHAHRWDHAVSRAQRLQHLGVPRERHARGRQRLLVNRRGDDCRHLARQRMGGRLFDAGGCGGTGTRIDPTQRQ